MTKNPLPAAPRATLCAFALSSLLVAQVASAATLAISSPSVAPGESGDVCVFMSGSGAKVAGVQMNLNWDPSCAVANSGSGNSASCRSNPATGKNVQSVIAGGPCHHSPNCLSAFLFSIGNTAPIPDGQLFCCSFSVVNPPSGDRCDIAASQTILSTPAGKQFTDFSVQNGSIYVVSTGGGGSQPAAGGVAPGAPAVEAPGAAPVTGGGEAPAAAPGAPAAAPGAPAAAPRAPVAGGPLGVAPETLEEAPVGGVPPVPQGGAVPVGQAAQEPPVFATPERTPEATAAAPEPTAVPRTRAPRGTPTARAVKTAAAAQSPTVKPTAAETPAATPKATAKTRPKTHKKKHKKVMDK